jgi:Tfp pilus assembly protein PilO
MSISGRNTLKRWVLRALVGFVVLDAGLALYVWRTASSHSQTESADLERLRDRHRQYGDDVRRAERIVSRLPEVERECNRFYDAQFLATATGYSAVVADLGSIAKKAGLPPTTIGFKQREIEKRGVVEVEVTAAVEGDYPALVRFVNGLERSEHLYLLDSLSLSAGQEKRVKLNLQMKTYLRAAA